MKNENFWGKVEEDWAGFSAEKTFSLPYFNKGEIRVFLGAEFDDNFEEIDTPPSQKQLDDYEKTFSDFINNIETVIVEIKEKTFSYYKEIYSHYYENKAKSGEEPLHINNPEKHFEYIKDLEYIRVLDGNILQIPIHYGLDSEHGIEIKLKDNKVTDIAGIAET